jgi:hypothetical protein
MDQKLIIWDLSHQSSRCSCELRTRCELLSSFSGCSHDLFSWVVCHVLHGEIIVVGGRDMPGMAGFDKVRGIRMHRRQGAHLGQPLW